MVKKDTFSRRDFFKTSILGLSSLLVLKTQSISALAADKELSEDEPLAKSLGYHKDSSKVDAKKWPKKGMPDGKTQTCDSCVFYKASATKNKGNCQIFQNQLVASKGWCNTWAKKPA